MWPHEATASQPNVEQELENILGTWLLCDGEAYGTAAISPQDVMWAYDMTAN